MDSMEQALELALEGINADLVDSEGRNILYRVAIREYSDTYINLIRILLEYGIQPEPTNPSILKPFIAVLENGDLESVQLMIHHGINLRNYVTHLPLHATARNPRLEVLKFLLSTKIFDLNELNGLGQTALFEAACAKNPEAVEFLLSLGLDPNLADSKKYMILHRMLYDDETEATTKCVEILLRHGADPDAEIMKGLGAMSFAAASEHHSEHIKRLRLFLDHGAGQKDEAAKYHVLRTLIVSGDLETLQLYMRQRDIDLSKCKDEWSLSMALHNRYPGVFEFLLSPKIFDATKIDDKSMDILWEAAFSCNPTALELLLEWGVEVDTKMSPGLTALHITAFEAGKEKKKDTNAKCIELLLLYGADINSQHPELLTAFEMAMPDNKSQWALLSKISAGALRILEHANLLESQGKYLKSHNFHQRQSENKLCLDELEALKAEILGNSVTLYDLLVHGNSKFYWEKLELMQKIRDREYVRTLESRFPMYGPRLVKIVEYLNLREVAVDRLCHLVRLQKDSYHLIIKKIVRMLPIRDLRALNKI